MRIKDMGCFTGILVAIVLPAIPWCLMSIILQDKGHSPELGLVVTIGYIMTVVVVVLIFINKGKEEEDQEIQLKHKEDKNNEVSTYQHINSINDFSASKTLLVPNTYAFISVDEQRLKVLIGARMSHILIDVKKILDFELLEMVRLTSTTEKYGAIRSAALGGLLFGSTGAIVGATVGGKGGTSQVSVLGIKITLDDIEKPVVSVNLLSNEVARDSEGYQKTLLQAENWLGILKILKKRSTDH